MKVLLIDDDRAVRFALTELLKNNGYEVINAENGEASFELLKNNMIDAAIVDYQLPGMNGLKILERIKSDYSSVQVILITAFGNEEIAVKAIRNGAFDYISKPFSNEELLNRLNHIKTTLVFKGDFINEKFGWYFSDKMKKIIEKTITAAKTDIPVLITGESGTGKELIARLIHYYSARAGRFIPVNCSAIPAGIMESELFGSEKGSYTGSYKTKPGFFEAADNGSLFLDEIGEMEISLQSKLLRVLQEGEITRIGSSEPVKINTRIIAATNLDIESEVKARKFREDLYYRLNCVNISVPPLKERKDEIRNLIQVFILIFNEKYKKNIRGIKEDAFEILKNYSWPGNIRELKNKMEETVIFCSSDWINLKDIKLNKDVKTSSHHAGKIDNCPESAAKIKTVIFPDMGMFPEKITDAKKAVSGEFEKEFILYHLNKNGWKVSDTAAGIGMYRQDLYKKIRYYNLKKTH